jgi:hypothetical protein
MQGALARIGSPGRRLAASLLAVLAALAPALPAGSGSRPSQSGSALELHPAYGISFPLARSYAQIPTQPDERWIVLYYAEDLPKDPAARKAVRPVMGIVSIDHPSGAGGESSGSNGAQGADDLPRLAPPEIDGIESWALERMPSWTLSAVTERKERGGYVRQEYRLAQKTPGTPRQVGWVCAWSNEARTVAIVGVCAVDDLPLQEKVWRASADRLRFTTPVDESEGELAKRYAGGTLRDPEFRVAVRKKLPRGWRAADTENYIVVYDTADQPLIRKLSVDIELLRAKYIEYFPPVAALTRVSTVRVCKDRDEYLAYGGMTDSAGYWNASSEELVLYDARKPQKNLPDDSSETFLVLYHEAFHQYIHYSTGELPPHPWFNEGHGDFFAGAQIRGKVETIGINPWRVDFARNLVEGGTWVPWSRIVRLELRPFMEDSFRCYAQSWSMIHFLRTSPEVARREEWARILPRYFETLKLAFAEEVELLGERRDDLVERWKAGFQARNRAVDAAFEGVDFEEIERAWILHVRGLAGAKSAGGKPQRR